MPISIRYPASGGTGAVAGGNLATACGQYTPPPPGVLTTIRGKVYAAGAALDASPPSDSSLGSCLAGNWDFNSCWPKLGSGLVVGTGYVLRVWQKDSNSSTFQPANCEFTACQNGVGGCTPNCGTGPVPPPPPPPPPGPAPAPSFYAPFGCEALVIREVAARQFRVTPSCGVVDLLEMFYGLEFDPEDLPPIIVTYDAAVSTHDRAIWTSQPQNGVQFRLEVRRGGCCYEAVMTRIRVLPQSMETLALWGATCFDLVAGGELGGLTTDCCARDGGIEVRPVGEQQPIAPAAPRPRRAPDRAPDAPRARRGSA